MKILCMACKSAYRLVALRGAKVADTDSERRVVIRCALCSDQSSVLAARPVPVTERQRDDVRLRLLDAELWPTATRDCRRGKLVASDYLVCTGCVHYAAVSREFCDRARERQKLLERVYDDEQDDLAQPGLDD